MRHDNYWNIGNLSCSFSYIENIVNNYAISFGNEYEERKSLFIKKYNRDPLTRDMLKILSKIHNDQNMDDKFKSAFEKLRDDMNNLYKSRNIILHGMWCISGGVVTKPLKGGKEHHFSNIEELVALYKDCLMWVKEFKNLNNTKFEDITDIKLQELIEEKGLQYCERYIFYLGKFVLEFSQLEFNIRYCYMLLHGYSDNQYNKISDRYTSSLISEIFKLIEGDQLQKMESQFYEVNELRNEIVHECFKLGVSFERLYAFRG